MTDTKLSYYLYVGYIDKEEYDYIIQSRLDKQTLENIKLKKSFELSTAGSIVSEIEIASIGILTYLKNTNKDDKYIPISKNSYLELLKHSKLKYTYTEYINLEKILFDKAKESDFTMFSINYNIVNDENVEKTIKSLLKIEKDSNFKKWMTNIDIIDYIKSLLKWY